jgi:hypothetical protein
MGPDVALLLGGYGDPSLVPILLIEVFLLKKHSAGTYISDADVTQAVSSWLQRTHTHFFSSQRKTSCQREENSEISVVVEWRPDLYLLLTIGRLVMKKVKVNLEQTTKTDRGE